jgi:hypothetical protein
VNVWRRLAGNCVRIGNQETRCQVFTLHRVAAEDPVSVSCEIKRAPSPILTARQKRKSSQGFDTSEFGGIDLTSEEQVRAYGHNESIRISPVKKPRKEKVIQRTGAAQNHKANPMRLQRIHDAVHLRFLGQR